MKLTCQPMTPPKIWAFAKDHLPASLKAVKNTDGYGGIYCVQWMADTGKTNFFGFPVYENVCTFNSDNSVVINHPQYFSDIEKMVLAYEKKYKTEVEVLLYEDP